MENYQSEEIKYIITEDELLSQLRHLGIREGMTLEVHCAFSKLGPVIGGPTALNNALIRAVGEDGNIVMANQDYNNTEPLFWENPPIDFRLMKKVRENSLGFDVRSSALHLMGILVDEMRSRKDTSRSYHPNCAFIAYGKDAKYLMSNQPLSFPLGMKSPLGKMYAMDNVYTLLIGCDYDNCTSWHLAQYLSGCYGIIMQGGCVKKDGENQWKKYLDYDIDSHDFCSIGKLLEKNEMIKTGKLQDAVCKLFKMRETVDFACDFLRSKYE
ncbi:MAG: AAC(3) family N-acetyltransferase [Erysipelotrichia bacterium]|nr:AAC(3) family N-acetyltransferase [Erysipelotrichia bacterium]